MAKFRILLDMLCKSNKQKNMVQYKLHYFEFPGRGQPIRMLFHYAEQPFEDLHIKGEDFPTRRTKFPYGQVPVLEVDGKLLAQTPAILQFLGKKFGLAGKDDWEQAKAAELACYLQDVDRELESYVAVKIGYRQGDVNKLRKEVFLPGVEKHYPRVERILAESNSGFLLPSGISYVDFGNFNFLSMSTVKQEEPEIFGKYPKMAQYMERMQGLPQLKEYMAKRKG